MPEIKVEIGGRLFDVACQPGEEAFLRAAVDVLDREARQLTEQMGRQTESKLLLMSGLIVADRCAGLEDQLAEAELRIAALNEQLEQGGAHAPASTAARTKPDGSGIDVSTLTELTTRAEALAAIVGDATVDMAIEGAEQIEG